MLTKKKLLYIIFIMMSIEFGGDPILRSFSFDANLIGSIYQFIIAGLIFLTLLIFKIKPTNNINLSFSFWMILLILIVGLIHGLLMNSWIDALNEALPFFLFVIFIAFASEKTPVSILYIQKFLTTFIYIVFFKFIIYLFMSFIINGDFSWKILLKQSPFLLLPLSIYFMKISRGKITFNDYIKLFMLLVLIIFSMARMLMLATVFLFVVHFFNKNILRGISLFIMITLSISLYVLLIQMSPVDIGDFIYGGDIYEEGLSYRIEQFEVIMNRIFTSPLLGVGFGYFTPGYLTYGEAPKPYLLELDILNFISKIGLIGLFVYALAYIWIYILILSIPDKNMQSIYKALFWGLMALIVYSLGQTGHQSYIYWVILAFLYGNAVSQLRLNANLKVSATA
jgi:hypothetical protein